MPSFATEISQGAVLVPLTLHFRSRGTAGDRRRFFSAFRRLAHSKGFACSHLANIAFLLGHGVGVDIECHRHVADWLSQRHEIASTSFHQSTTVANLIDGPAESEEDSVKRLNALMRLPPSVLRDVALGAVLDYVTQVTRGTWAGRNTTSAVTELCGLVRRADEEGM